MAVEGVNPGVPGAAPYRLGSGGFDDPGWGLAMYASSVRIGVVLAAAVAITGAIVGALALVAKPPRLLCALLDDR